MVGAKFGSAAISSSMLMSPALPRPPPLRGSGARRVHRTTLSALGDPEATPNVKGLLAPAIMLLLFSLKLQVHDGVGIFARSQCISIQFRYMLCCPPRLSGHATARCPTF